MPIKFKGHFLLSHPIPTFGCRESEREPADAMDGELHASRAQALKSAGEERRERGMKVDPVYANCCGDASNGGAGKRHPQRG